MGKQEAAGPVPRCRTHLCVLCLRSGLSRSFGLTSNTLQLPSCCRCRQPPPLLQG